MIYPPASLLYNYGEDYWEASFSFAGEGGGG